MLFSIETTYIVQNERFADQRRQAAHRRLVHICQPGRSGRGRRVMNRLGDLLVNLVALVGLQTTVSWGTRVDADRQKHGVNDLHRVIGLTTEDGQLLLKDGFDLP